MCKAHIPWGASLLQKICCGKSRERLEGSNWENPQTKPTRFSSKLLPSSNSLWNVIRNKDVLHKIFSFRKNLFYQTIVWIGPPVHKQGDHFFFLKMVLNQTKGNEKEKRVNDWSTSRPPSSFWNCCSIRQKEARKTIIGQVHKQGDTFFFLKLLLNQTKGNKKKLLVKSTNKATPFSSRHQLMLLPVAGIRWLPNSTHFYICHNWNCFMDKEI